MGGEKRNRDRIEADRIVSANHLCRCPSWRSNPLHWFGD